MRWRTTNCRIKRPILGASGVALVLACFALTACFTQNALQGLNGKTVIEAPWIRVDACWTNPDGRLVVLAHGGLWQADVARIAPDRYFLAINAKAISDIPQLNGRDLKLPQRVLKRGWPERAALEEAGFRRTSFSEWSLEQRKREHTEPNAEAIRIIYTWWSASAAFPEGIGMEPNFEVSVHSRLVRFYLSEDAITDRQFSSLALLPATVPLDAICFPVEWALAHGNSGLE